MPLRQHFHSFLLGPPIGGVVYKRFGFRGVCIFGIIGAVIDLVARLIVIERKDALEWGFDPQSVILPETPENNLSSTDIQEEDTPGPPQEEAKEGTSTAIEEHNRQASIRSREVAGPQASNEKETVTGVTATTPQLSLFAVLIKLFKSSRAMATVVCFFVHGCGTSSSTTRLSYPTKIVILERLPPHLSPHSLFT